MAISKEMWKKLNEQITHEYYAAHLYLQMAAEFERMNLRIFAQRFYIQIEEERLHARKFYDHLIGRGEKVELGKMDAPKKSWKTPLEIMKAAHEHEVYITKLIDDLVKQCEKDGDYASRGMLQYFVDEQVEELAWTSELIELINMSGNQILYVESRLQELIIKINQKAAAKPAVK